MVLQSCAGGLSNWRVIAFCGSWDQGSYVIGVCTMLSDLLKTHILHDHLYMDDRMFRACRKGLGYRIREVLLQTAHLPSAVSRPSNVERLQGAMP